MTASYYHGDGRGAPEARSVPAPGHLGEPMPEAYRADPGLARAVNVALLLGQPLLLTGAPGTGKTHLAYNLAWELGWGEPLRFDVKTTSTARDLIYTYDALGRLQAAQSGVPAPPLDFLTWNAFGCALLLAREAGEVAAWLPEGFEHDGPRRSVVLIDEIDKAPRDFPNDLLAELEEMSARVPELAGARLSAPPEQRPVVVITSNSERDLPDAFLRRTVYYNLPFPSPERLAAIVEGRLGPSGTGDLLDSALEVFELLRDAGLRRGPSTAELIAWVMALRELGGEVDNPLAEEPGLALDTLSVLVKTEEDQEAARRVVEQWIAS